MKESIKELVSPHLNKWMYLSIIVSLIFFLFSISSLKVNLPVFLALKEPANLSQGMIYDLPEGIDKIKTIGEKTGVGAITIGGNNSIKPMKYHLSNGELYELYQGIEICDSVKKCYGIDTPQLLFVSKENSGKEDWWTTLMAPLSLGAPLSKGIIINSDRDVDAYLISTKVTENVKIKLLKGHNSLKTEIFTQYDFYRIPFVIIFTMVVLLFVYGFIRWNINNYRSNHKVIWPILFLGMTLIVRYIAFFPGFFYQDTLVAQTNSGYFSIWYSSLYMIYNIGMNIFSPYFIQLPLVISFFWIFSYLISQIYTNFRGRYITWLLLVIQFVDPSITSIIFSTQRYFLASLVILCGLTIVLFNRKKQILNYYLGNILIFIAALLRTEYWLIFVVVNIIYFVINSQLFVFHRKKIFCMFCTFLIAFIVIDGIIPKLYNPYSKTIKTYYKLATLLNIAEPYINCQDPNDPYLKVLYKITDQAGKACHLDVNNHSGIENFFWDHVRRNDNRDISIEYNELFQLTRESIIKNPRAEAMHAIEKLSSLLTVRHWNVYSKYEKTITVKELINPGMVALDLKYSWQESMNKYLISIYMFISSLLPNFIWFIYILVVCPIILEEKVCRILNSIIIAMTLLIGVLAPSYYQWGYLILLPIWGMLSVACRAIPDSTLFKLS